MKKSLIATIILAAIAIPTAVYAASPLFINTTVDEQLPAVAIEDKMMGKDEPPVVTENQLSGRFIGVGDGIHNVAGTAKVIPVDGNNVLRLEDFKSTNGPDLYLYLSSDKQASDSWNWAGSKGT